MISRSVCRALGLGMASEKTNSEQATKYISRMDPFPASGVPPCEAAPGGAIGVLTPAQVKVKPISQTRCQPDANSEQRRKTKRNE
jgi:hypothetical protein